MDNFYKNCPPLMDGRFLGDFKTETRRNEYIKYINDIYRDDQYRIFLQKNATKILDREWEYNKKNNSCWENECVHNYPTRSLPSEYAQERKAYDSMCAKRSYPSTCDEAANVALAQYRVCEKFDDYRLNPKYPLTYDNLQLLPTQNMVGKNGIGQCNMTKQ